MQGDINIPNSYQETDAVGGYSFPHQVSSPVSMKLSTTTVKAGMLPHVLSRNVVMIELFSNKVHSLTITT